MKQFLLILTFLIFSCQEKETFADDIVLSFPHDEKMTFQKFNRSDKFIVTRFKKTKKLF